MREEALSDNDLAQRLGSDPRFPLCEEQITAAISRSRSLTGMASHQVESFVGKAEKVAAGLPEVHEVEKGRLL